MRTLARNQQPVWYANYVSSAEIVDSDNYATGDFTHTYSNPARVMHSVSVVRSDVEVAMFGVSAINTIAILADTSSSPINETARIWYGVAPVIEGDGSTKTPHNYRVVGI